MRQRILSILVVLAIIPFSISCSMTASSKQLSDIEKNHIVRKLIEDKDFIGIFRKSRQIGTQHRDGGDNYLVSDAVMAYLQTGYLERDKAIQLLEDNGFKVHTGGVFVPRPSRPDDKPYEERVEGSRRAKPVNFYVWETFRVFLYLQDGKVDRVLAHAYTDAL